MGRVVVVGLGPAGPEFVTPAVASAIARVPRRFLRTARHPSAGAVPGATAFDDVYESAASLPEVYGRIVDALVEATDDGDVLFAVPGSPLVAERTVELLRDDTRVDVEVVPGLSFLDLAWARLGVDPVAAGVRLIDGQRFGVEAAGQRGPLLVAQCDSRAVLSDVKLAAEEEAPDHVVVLHHLGLPDETVTEVEWADLDRVVEPDHLTSLYVRTLAAPIGAEVARFSELVRTLRERCPWDREQTHESLTRHLLEETYEVLEAIQGLASGDGYPHLEEELGDLLFQVVFHATLASEAGAFTLADVARGIHDKLVGRHPHVFGDVEAHTAGQVMRNWEQIKQAEKGRSSLMDGIAGDLPSLLYAHKVQRKAASVGVEWSPTEASDAVRDVLGVAEVHAVEHDVGPLLFGVVAAARRLGVDPEAALRAMTAAFRRRFERMERLAANANTDLHSLDPTGIERLWNEAASAADTL